MAWEDRAGAWRWCRDYHGEAVARTCGLPPMGKKLAVRFWNSFSGYAASRAVATAVRCTLHFFVTMPFANKLCISRHNLSVHTSLLSFGCLLANGKIASRKRFAAWKHLLRSYTRMPEWSIIAILVNTHAPDFMYVQQQRDRGSVHSKQVVCIAARQENIASHRPPSLMLCAHKRTG